jgi:hypothetical protein
LSWWKKWEHLTMIKILRNGKTNTKGMEIHKIIKGLPISYIPVLKSEACIKHGSWSKRRKTSKNLRFSWEDMMKSYHVN